MLIKSKCGRCGVEFFSRMWDDDKCPNLKCKGFEIPENEFDEPSTFLCEECKTVWTGDSNECPACSICTVRSK